MKYWAINIWRDFNNRQRLLHRLHQLKYEYFDAVLLFCHPEWEFYNMDGYKRIVDIAKYKKIKIYAIIGADNKRPNIKLDDNIEVIYWPTAFFKIALLRYCDTSSENSSEIFIRDLGNLDYKYHFIYLNGRSHGWRSRLIDEVAKFDLLKHSAYSWHSTFNSEHEYPFKYFDGAKKILDENFTVDTQGCQIAQQYYQSFFQLVPESTIEVRFITEKTVLPLLIGKPFIVAGGAGFHELLKRLGFELYDELFDYSFDSIKDTDKRYKAICENIKNITQLPLDQCRQFHDKIQDKVSYNRKRAIQIAYDENFMPELAKYTVDLYKQTGKKLDSMTTDTEKRLENIKDKFTVYK